MTSNLIWILYRSDSHSAYHEALNCKKIIEGYGKKVLIFEISIETNNFNELISMSAGLPEIALVLGGDGTVLKAARHLSTINIPILSFNVGGNLGFLTHDRHILKQENFWERVSNNKFNIQKRMMLEATVFTEKSNNESKIKSSFFALNDFYFRSCTDEIAPTCSLELEIDGEAVDKYKGDGLIFSTPTGSTAYGMAAGGPIIHPSLDAIIVSAICPMSLASRPIVVPPESQLVIKPIKEKKQKIKLWLDGSSGCIIEANDKCLIKKSNHSTSIIILDENLSYYKTITQKLHWASSLSERHK
ncbi:NAD(+) kinase [Prochlorococcus marinus]|uniref:NAD kinase n=1 Tax=Prochlorococcus marinus XMU1408 TaxID=2213228 RepID=A0A318RCX9_PROMR|nr:NAD(+) kinase [Prochlorococcus marinus]MBW3041217.1 NAD(+) kinase [Prochlorococcus marinus str. XMU1408]PYE03808.1 NAD(+) kinase [Prochlorococcus marinus XMU1408]